MAINWEKTFDVSNGVAINDGDAAIGVDKDDTDKKMIFKDGQNEEAPLREMRFFRQVTNRDITIPENHAYMGTKLNIGDNKLIVDGTLILV